MQSSDNEQLERYLKQFQPLAPDPLPAPKSRQKFAPLFVPVAWIGASASILVAGFIVFHTRNGLVAGRPPVEPLTIASANSWLAAAPSFQTALDELALRAIANPFPPDKQSAIAELSEEGMK